MLTAEARRPNKSDARGYDSETFKGETFGDVDRQAEEWGATNILYPDGSRAVKLSGEWFVI